jgi:hypothetical protein
MKYRPRIDPYALNPEKILAAGAEKKRLRGAKVIDEIACKVAGDETVLGHVYGVSITVVDKKKPNPPPEPPATGGSGSA